MSREIQTISRQHQEIHEGESFFAMKSGTVGDGSDLEIRIQAPNVDDTYHFEYTVICTGQTTIDFYKGTSLVDVPNNRLVSWNRNENSSNTSSLLICHTPSGTGGDGTKIGDSLLIGLDTSLGQSGSIAGGTVSGRNEIVLGRGVAYLLRVTSGTDGNRVNIVLDWYIH